MHYYQYPAVAFSTTGNHALWNLPPPGWLFCSQAYVALSRATTLDGLHLLDFRIGVVKAHESVKNFYASLEVGTVQRARRLYMLGCTCGITCRRVGSIDRSSTCSCDVSTHTAVSEPFDANRSSGYVSLCQVAASLCHLARQCFAMCSPCFRFRCAVACGLELSIPKFATPSESVRPAMSRVVGMFLG